MKTNKRGVSLIVLVITIIIMIIIAGAIILALNGSGIVGRATEAKTKTNEAQIEEDNQMVKMEAMLNQTGKVYEEGEGQNKRTAMILPGLAIKPSGEGRELKVNTIETGLVAVDSNLNEYVWIEVPKTEAVYGAGNLNLDTNKAEDLAVIEEKLNEYSSAYNSNGTTTDGDEWYGWNDKNGSNWPDKNEIITKEMAEETPSLKINNKGCGLTYDEYYALKNKMLSSIYTNGGFWIGRYEAGTDTPRASKNDELTTVKSQINKYPYNHLTIIQAQSLASKMNTALGTTSSLMFGVQWNLVCKYIVENSNLNQSNMSDSRIWGNHVDTRFTIDRGKYYDSGTTWLEYDTLENNIKANLTSKLLTTGATDRNSILNIYDFAGNIMEWTLQHTNANEQYPCALRGGYYSHFSGNVSVIRRLESYPSFTSISYGFRVTLY